MRRTAAMNTNESARLVAILEDNEEARTVLLQSGIDPKRVEQKHRTNRYGFEKQQRLAFMIIQMS